MYGSSTAYFYSTGVTPPYPYSATSWPSSSDPCPDGWHVPTEAEITAMLNAATSKTWTTSGSINGMRYTFSSGNSIFLPAAGNRYYTGANLQGSYGTYWSATYDSSLGLGRDLYFYSGYTGTMGNANTYNASSVRCVRPV
jgi:uncharacterized protein (TIGR02145 family)